MKAWTNKEIEHLNSLLKRRLSLVIIAQLMDRSYESVRMFIRKQRGEHK